MSALRIALIAVLFAGVSLPAVAEEVAGQSALDAAREASSKGDHKAAIEEATRAIGLNAELHEAHLLLGEAQLASGDGKQALGTLRDLMSKLEGAVPLSKEDSNLWTRARKALTGASKPDAALDATLRKQAGKLASIASKWIKKDPKSAETAALQALTLVPTHSKALAALKKSRAGLTGRVEKLIDATMANWTWLTDKNWPVVKGVLVGNVEDRAMAIRTNRKWSGEYDVIWEGRVIETFRKNGPPLFALLTPYLTDTRLISFGFMNGTAEVFEWTSATDGDVAVTKNFDDFEPKIDPKEWTTYELRVRKDEVAAFVNGVELGRHPRAADFVRGWIGIKVQFCKAEIRRMDVIQR